MAAKRNAGVGAAVAAAALAGALAGRMSAPKPPDVAEVRGVMTIEKVVGGRVTESQSVNKRLVAGGIRLLVGQLCGDSAVPYDTAAFLAIGNDSTATDTAMTALQGDTLTWGNVDSITRGANWVRWWRTFTSAEGNHSWREVGLFADSAGTMLDRANVSWGTKTAADTWRVSLKLSFE